MNPLLILLPLALLGTPLLGGDPVKITCRSQADALQLGNSYARELNGSLMLTSGTPSMKPLIQGRVYIVVQKISYDEITKGSLLVYMGLPDARQTKRVTMLHRAVLRDNGGWLMSGDNNRWTESWDRVKPDNYIGTVIRIIEFPTT